ncbi:sigma-54-dependent transcriptional regulator [Salsuginibacillus kocurii]|uniref:sigma-54-dependent transcriptional regulator n=1 Tax=Salsuginibacillus kocurii TaxID=427078 RepID=UPI00036371CF|nr:sigma-54 dependent transcriptional regulator [Salsuginibacillus kocurii]
MGNLLIIDDDEEVGTFLAFLFKKQGHHVDIAYNGKDFVSFLQQGSYQLAMVDLKLPDANGLDLLKQLKQHMPACQAIVMTGYSTIQTAVEAIKNGANDYIEKPFEDITKIEDLVQSLLEEHQHQSATQTILERAKRVGLVVGESKEMQKLLNMTDKFAQKNITIMLGGETGTGKEVLARYIHEASYRSDQPFIAVNCGALSETLLESELFGHEQGAFTGATKLRKGLFEIANHGTLFLDEIGEASLTIQVKLLRILETREFMRVGGEETHYTNVRVIAASHINLEEAVRRQSFREDLLYRLNVVKLDMPPLRKRTTDIPILAAHFLQHHSEEPLKFSEQTLERLRAYNWPGNIRELFNVVTRAIALSEHETTTITEKYLPDYINKNEHELVSSDSDNGYTRKYVAQTEREASFLESYLYTWCEDLLTLYEESTSTNFDSIQTKLKEMEVTVERAFVEQTLRDTLGDRKKAASQLNINPRKIRYLLNEKRHSPW